jgi:hypothetical protein
MAFYIGAFGGRRNGGSGDDGLSVAIDPQRALSLPSIAVANAALI